MADQGLNIPRGFLHDAWWMSSDTEVSLPSGAQRDGLVRNHPLRVIFLIALILVAAADWLFWGHEAGLSLALFALLIAMGTLVVVGDAVTPARKSVALAVLAASVLPVIEQVQALSLLFYVAGIATFGLIIAERLTGDLARLGTGYATILFAGPLWLWRDGAAGSRSLQGSTGKARLTAMAMNWLVPLGLGLVFVVLFAQANPLIERWVGETLSFGTPDGTLVLRGVFWLGILCLVWPVLNLRAAPTAPVSERALTGAWTAPAFLNATAIRNALILFNLLFALQTTLDLAILWGGASLPEGMTYATYAHRGAYPLILTALLAGGFVILATSFGEVSGQMKGLIYLWIAQNVILVGSSILRLDLYIEVYSLTGLRIAALIWMGLVALGLMLIVARVALGKDNHWLLLTNGALAAAVLYISCFVNFAGVIATYNLDRPGGVSGVHQPWDIGYFCRLGHGGAVAKARHARATGIDIPCADQAAINHAPETAGWRDWGFRDWRLRRELANLGVSAKQAGTNEPDHPHRRR